MKTSSLKAAKRIELPSSFLRTFMNGGLPKGSSISLIGPPGAGKTVFCESLAKSFLGNGSTCLYVTMDSAPAHIRNDLNSMGIDIWTMENEKKLVFVDGYGWLTGNSEEAYHVESLANLAELLILIERARSSLSEESSALVVFDSISPLLLHNPENDTVKFLQSLSARIFSQKDVGMIVIQGGVHNEEFYNSIAYLVDGVFDMKIKEFKGKIKRQFRIRHLRFMPHRVEWVPFVIKEGKGFILQKKKCLSKPSIKSARMPMLA
ncbi:MAG: AAA family ATPase [Candidatus Bathyarchaeota archaeon]|nr:MAG: AAA family ATPase [Candidatus Bathyarchaeota archaeon]